MDFKERVRQSAGKKSQSAEKKSRSTGKASRRAGRKRGSAQAEAAMIMPLVILSVITVIWMLTLFFSQTAIRSGVHLALRSSAGICTETVLHPGEEGFGGLYGQLLSADEVEKLLEEQAQKYIAATGLKRRAELKGVFNRAALVSTLKLDFQKSYGRMGLYRGRMDGGGSCWYFNIDEAQWVRNEDWLHALVREKTAD